MFFSLYHRDKADTEVADESDDEDGGGALHQGGAPLFLFDFELGCLLVFLSLFLFANRNLVPFDFSLATSYMILTHDLTHLGPRIGEEKLFYTLSI